MGITLDRKYLQPVQAVPVQAAQPSQVLHTPQTAEQVNGWQVAGETAGDILGNVVAGAMKGLEGIYDIGASVVGTIGSWFDKDFGEQVKQHVARDYTQEWLGDALAEGTKHSALNTAPEAVQRLTRGVAQGVGNMVPVVGATLLTGGLGAGAAVAKGAGMATLGVSAAGGGTEEAFQGGANYGEGLAYGALSGALEVGTEKLFGGAWDSIVGKGIADKAIANIAKKSVTNKTLQNGIKVLMQAGGEGAEEMVSEFMSPYLKRITYDPDADPATVQSVVEAGLIGGITALAYGQTVGRAVDVMQGRDAKIDGSVEHYNAMEDVIRKEWSEGKLTDQAYENLRTHQKADYADISERLAKHGDKAAKFTERADIMKIFGRESAQTQEGGTYNREAYSPSLRGLEENLRFKPTEQALTDAQKEAKRSLYKLTKDSELTGIVFTDDAIGGEDVNANGGYVNKEGVMYISTKADPAKVVMLHELTHAVENTKGHDGLSDAIQKTIETDEEYREKYGKEAMQNLGYTEEQSASESTAKFVSEVLFNDEASVKRIARGNEGLAKKTLNFVRDTIEKLTLSKEDRAKFKQLRKYEKLYAAALEQAKRGEIRLDTAADEQYAKKKSFAKKRSYYDQGQSLVMSWAFSDKVKDGDVKTVYRNGEYITYRANSSLEMKCEEMSRVSEKEYQEKVYGIDERASIDDPVIERYRNDARGENGGNALYVDGQEHSSLNGLHGSKPDGEHGGDRSGSEANLRSGVKKSKNDEQYSLSDKSSKTLTERDFESVLDYLDSFKSVEDIKSYFDRVQSMINDEASKFYPKTMADVSAKERQRVERVIKAANIEKEAIQAYRKKHKAKPVVDLSTQAKIAEVDRQYAEAIAKNDLETARYLVEQMALIKGYSVTDYRIDHQAPYNDGYSASLDDVTSMFGEDIYGTQAAQYFGTFEGFDNESVSHIQRARKRPELYVRIYRAVPMSIKSDQIRNGDWITLTRKYAEEHGKSNIIGNYRVITAVGKAKHIYTDGNSIHEFGYDDGSNYYYRDTKNFKKLADVITFDDEGNSIRLRDRFNFRKDDIRYSLPETDSQGRRLTQEQREYFKDSKVVDEHGRLLKVYHGTLDKNFFTFEKEYVGTRMLQDNVGFFFTDQQTVAKEYAINEWERADSPDRNGRVIEVYLNITNPLTEKIDYDAIYHWDTNYEELLAKAKRLRKDGVIIRAKKYDSLYVAFEPNQIKAVDNNNPTYAADIRYSLSDAAQEKTYTKKDAERILDEGIFERLYGENIGKYDGVFKGKSKAEIVAAFQEKLNAAKPADRRKIAVDAATYVLAREVLGKDITRKADAKSWTAEEWTAVRGAAEALAPDILRQMTESGKPSRTALYARLALKYREQVFNLHTKLIEARMINKKVNRIRGVLEAIRVKHEKKQVNVLLAENQGFRDFAKKMASAKLWTGDVSEAKLKQTAQAFLELYNAENPLFEGEGVDEDIRGYAKDVLMYDGKSDYLNFIFNAERMVSAIKKLEESYDKIFIAGKRVSLRATAAKGYAEIKEAKKAGGVRLEGYARFLQNVRDPRSSLAALSGFREDSVVMKLFGEIQKGGSKVTIVREKLLGDLRTAMKGAYGRQLKKRKMTIVNANGTAIEVPATVALSLYLTATQEHALAGLEKNGFVWYEGRTKKESGSVGVQDMEAMAKQFTAEDKKLLEAVRGLYAKSTELKTETDLELFGYTNVLDGEYYPIHRDGDERSRNMADPNRARMVKTLFNLSFNQNRVAGAKGTLEIHDVVTEALAHAGDISKYYALSVPLDNFGRAYGLIIDDEGRKSSIRGQAKPFFKDGDNYVYDLLSDIIGARNNGSGKVLTYLRSAYSTAALGLNPKIMLTQLASIPAMFSYFDTDVMLRAFGQKVNFKEMIANSEYAKARYLENAPLLAEGILDQTGKIANATTAGIRFTDKLAYGYMWSAATLQVDKDIANQGLKLTAEERMSRIVEKFDEVGRRTQPNYEMSERAEWQRGKSEIKRFAMMFKSVSMKYLSMTYTAAGRLYSDYRRLKAADPNSAEYARAKADYKLSQKFFAKTLGGVATAQAMFVVIGQLFKMLLGKKREDKDGNEISFGEEFALNLAGAYAGMVPILGDVYDKFAFGYEVGDFSYSMINDMLNAAESAYNIVASWGESGVNPQQLAAAARRVFYSAGAIVGMPVRNVNNLFGGLLKRIDFEKGYRYDALFFRPKYRADLEDAIANDDTDRAEAIVRAYMIENGLDGTASDKEISELYKQGFDVLPRAIRATVTVNGEEKALTLKEQEALKKEYAKADEEAEKLVKSSAYKALGAAGRAKALKFVYDTVYGQALTSVLGAQSGKRELFAAGIPLSDLAAIIAVCDALEADKDSSGRVIAGSKKKKVAEYISKLKLTSAQKYMLMGYLGYKNVKGEDQVAAFIGTLAIPYEQKAQLLEWSGYAA